MLITSGQDYVTPSGTKVYFVSGADDACGGETGNVYSVAIVTVDGHVHTPVSTFQSGSMEHQRHENGSHDSSGTIYEEGTTEHHIDGSSGSMDHTLEVEDGENEQHSGWDFHWEHGQLMHEAMMNACTNAGKGRAFDQ